MVTISVARLKQLEELEASLPTLLASAGMDRLKKLNEMRKANPAEHNKRVLKRYHKNKDEINARRREAYKAKKATAAATATE